jgi:hypothetical protein
MGLDPQIALAGGNKHHKVRNPMLLWARLNR